MTQETCLPNQRCVAPFSWLNGSSHQLLLAKLHQNKRRTSEGCTARCGAELFQVTSLGWAHELKAVCWQLKPKKKHHGLLRSNRNQASWAQSSLVWQTGGCWAWEMPVPSNSPWEIKALCLWVKYNYTEGHLIHVIGYFSQWKWSWISMHCCSWTRLLLFQCLLGTDRKKAKESNPLHF